MNEILRQGMVKTVTVREYEDEPKYIKVTIKAPTELPVAAWQSSTKMGNRHVDEIDIALPLDAVVRPGDLVAIAIQITDPYTETQRFRPALEVGRVEVLDEDVDDDDDDDDEDDDVLEVMVEDSMKDDG